jgi:hypothetical protein
MDLGEADQIVAGALGRRERRQPRRAQARAEPPPRSTAASSPAAWAERFWLRRSSSPTGVPGGGVSARRFSALRLAHSASWPGSSKAWTAGCSCTQCNAPPGVDPRWASASVLGPLANMAVITRLVTATRSRPAQLRGGNLCERPTADLVDQGHGGRAVKRLGIEQFVVAHGDGVLGQGDHRGGLERKVAGGGFR